MTGSPAPTDRTRAVAALYRALAARDLAAAQTLLIAEPVWDITRGAPDGGIYRGMAEVFDGFYRQLGERYHSFAVRPDRLMDAGGHVVAVGDYLIVRSPGEPEAEVRFAHVFPFADDGRITGVWQVADTAALP